jgi:hypothetical protein
MRTGVYRYLQTVSHGGQCLFHRAAQHIAQVTVHGEQVITMC